MSRMETQSSGAPFVPFVAFVAVAWAFGGCGTSGGPCDTDADCSGEERCVDGTCGRSPGGGPCEPGEICRAAAGPCDVAEVCPESGLCPADKVESVGTVCRPPAGTCDLEERCTGESAQCPEDRLSPETTVCRGAAGGCDVDERCSGASPHCPPDTLAPKGLVCRPSRGTCDVAETCTGDLSACPTDSFADPGTECRPSGGDCDLAEVCTGTSSACPSDSKVDPGTLCREPVNNCDLGEVCDGQSDDCPDDTFQPPNTVCAAPGCQSGQFTPQRLCVGGEATCATVSTVSCNGFQCDAASLGCRTTCSSDADCLGTHYCQPGPPGLCAPRKADGLACSGATSGVECLSGICSGSYVDADGDGFGTGGVGFFCGASAPAGRASVANDCCDSDNRAWPGNPSYYTAPRDCGGGYDFNCDGVTTRQYTGTDACNDVGGCSFGSMSCSGTTGWSGTTAPACGVNSSFVTSCVAVQTCNQTTCPGCESCNPITTTRTQACR